MLEEVNFFNSGLDFHIEWSKFYSEKCSLARRTLGNIFFLFMLLLKPNFFWTFLWFLVWSWEMSLLNRPQNWILDVFVKCCLPLRIEKLMLHFPIFQSHRVWKPTGLLSGKNLSKFPVPVRWRKVKIFWDENIAFEPRTKRLTASSSIFLRNVVSVEVLPRKTNTARKSPR